MAVCKGLGVVVLAAGLAGPGWAETVKLTLLGVGDVYNFAGNGTQGGFARLNAVAKAEKAANPNTLYLFDGDGHRLRIMRRERDGAGGKGWPAAFGNG